jgi:chemotaxis protein MotB
VPEPENSAAPVIIIKKKQNHGGHHGGAWKVAYADFVTAMMALFIVLWLLSTSQKVQKAVASYFKDPTGNGKLAGSSMAGTGESVSVTKDNMGQLKEKLEQAMKTMPQFQQMKDNVELTITNEGLRVELLETENGMFFESGNAHPTSRGEELLLRLADELGKLPNTVLIEGHTDAKPYSANGAYSNWELSADRANSARRLMQANGLRPDQVAQVRGYADQHLRNPLDPMNATNRRISVIVKYLNAPQTVAKPENRPEQPASGATAHQTTAKLEKAPAQSPPAKAATPPPAKAAH